MKNARSMLAPIVAVSLLASVILSSSFSGAYVRSTAADRYTYWIGPVSTTIPFAFWAIVTLLVASMGRERPDHLLATNYGYVAGWLAMTAFGLWIILLPKGPGNSSSMGIAAGLTPLLFAPIFPIFFLLGYVISRLLSRLKYEPGTDYRLQQGQ